MIRVSTPSSPLALYRRPAREMTAGGSGGAAPLVLGHALGSSHAMWDDVLPLLPPHLPIIVWDQPGHGQSGLLDVSAPTALDTARALNDALRDIGVDRAHIVGLSLGGMVSLAYAEIFPAWTASLGILGSGPSLPPATAWVDRAETVEQEGLGGLVDGTMDRWFTPAFANGVGAAHVARIRQIFLETNPSGYAQCCRILANTDLSADLATVSMPTLVMTGEDDAGSPPAAAIALAQRLPGAGDAVIVEHARHLTAVERPQAVADAIATLVTSHPG